ATSAGQRATSSVDSIIGQGALERLARRPDCCSIARARSSSTQSQPRTAGRHSTPSPMLPHRPTILPGLVTLAASVALVASLSARAAAQQTSDAGPESRAAMSATVSGVVFDSLSGKPLADALVQVVARGENARAWNATSGAGGEFEIDGVPRG